MVFYVYIIQSEKDGKFYTGHTANLNARITRYNDGRVTSTKHRRPLKLFYFEEFNTRSEAMKREAYLKTSEG